MALKSNQTVPVLNKPRLPPNPSQTSPGGNHSVDSGNSSGKALDLSTSSSSSSDDQQQQAAATTSCPSPPSPNRILLTEELVRQTRDSWYRPNLSRDDAIMTLKTASFGSFLVRDSTSYVGGFGLALRIEKLSEKILAGCKENTDLLAEHVRHYLIESIPIGNGKFGYQLKGSLDEPVYPSLDMLIYKHIQDYISLPIKLDVTMHLRKITQRSTTLPVKMSSSSSSSTSRKLPKAPKPPSKSSELAVVKRIKDTHHNSPPVNRTVPPSNSIPTINSIPPSKSISPTKSVPPSKTVPSIDKQEEMRPPPTLIKTEETPVFTQAESPIILQSSIQQQQQQQLLPTSLPRSISASGYSGVVQQQTQSPQRSFSTKPGYGTTRSSASNSMSSQALYICKLVYVGCKDCEKLAGPAAVERSINAVLDGNRQTSEIEFKIQRSGLTLTDSNRKLFFRKHFNKKNLLTCDIDPKSRKFPTSSSSSSSQLGKPAQLFGIVVQASGQKNQCHILAEVDHTVSTAVIVAKIQDFVKDILN